MRKKKRSFSLRPGGNQRILPGFQRVCQKIPNPPGRRPQDSPGMERPPFEFSMEPAVTFSRTGFAE